MVEITLRLHGISIKFQNGTFKIAQPDFVSQIVRPEVYGTVNDGLFKDRTCATEPTSTAISLKKTISRLEKAENLKSSIHSNDFEFILLCSW